MKIKYQNQDVYKVKYKGQIVNKVSYQGNIADFTYTGFQKDTSRINQSELKYECGIGQASLNLFTGRMTFVAPDITIGANSFEISVFHVYNSKWIGSNGIGNGWKLNIEQYCYPYEANDDEAVLGFQANDYVYLDAVGNKHRFVWYKLEGGRDYYYDAMGTGLVMNKTSSDIIEIVDDQKNLLLFNNKNQLSKIVSGKNGYIIKTITYSGTQITSIADDRKSNRKLLFVYNSFGYLQSITCEENSVEKKVLNYYYDDKDNLIKTTRKVGNASKDTGYFIYDQHRLVHAYAAEDKSVLNFLYTVNGLNNTVNKVNAGVMKPLTAALELPSNQIKTHNVFDCSSTLTTVTNEKGIKLAYFFNQKGFTTSILEDVGNQDYKTMFKTNGWSLMPEGNDSSTKINGKKVTAHSSNTYSVSSTKLDDFKALFNKHSNGTDSKYLYTEKYVLSFWLKLSSITNSDITAKLAIITKTSADLMMLPTLTRNLEYKAKIDKTAADSWQYVTIPIDFECYRAACQATDYNKYFAEDYLYELKTMIESMKLIFEGLSNGLQIADLRIAVGSQNKMLIDDTDFAFAEIIKFENNNLPDQREISSDFFMTESDIFLTYKNMYHRIGNGSFDIVACGSSKRLVADSLGFTIGNTYYPFSIDNNNGVPNYISQTKQRAGKKKWLLSENRIIFDDNNYQFEVRAGTISDFTTSMPSSASKTMISNYYSGLPKSKKDAYDVISENLYDNYGNLESTQVYKQGDTEKIIQEITYDSNNESLRETVNEATDNAITGQQTFKSPFMQRDTSTILGGSPSRYQKENSFDDFGEKITSIKAKSGNSVLAANNYYFDENGRLEEVTDQANRSYGFSYNDFGDLTSYMTIYSDGTSDELLSKQYLHNYGSQNDTRITETYLAGNSTETRQTILDKYGRMKKTTDNNNTSLVEYLYKEVEESATVAKIEEIYDSYEERTYVYEYDDENRPCGYKVTAGSGVKTGYKRVKAQQIEANTTQYTLYENQNNDNTVRTTSIIKEDEEVTSGNKIYLEPRIHQTIDFDSTFDNNAKKDFEFVYSYDKFGRLDTKVRKGTQNKSFTHSVAYLQKNNQSTTLIDNCLFNIHHLEVISNLPNIQKTVTTNCDFSFEYSYDNRGNISSITEKSEGTETTQETLVGIPQKPQVKILIPKHQAEISYQYDAMDRLSYEKNTALNLERTFQYDNGGRLQTITEASTTKSFSYNSKGQLHYYYEGGSAIQYSYDKYGNRTSAQHLGQSNPQTMTWTRGNLLNSFNTGSSLYQYDYNHQGVRFKKSNGALTKFYYLDGSRILGEDWATQDAWNNYAPVTIKKLRYFYDANGIAGIRVDGVNYNFLVDALGSVRKIFKEKLLVCEYDYDALGECKKTTYYDDNGQETQSPISNHIGIINPIRWKSYYFDTEMELYYINGRHYDPKVGFYVNADNPENLFVACAAVNGLDRNAITLDNTISVMANSDSIFTAVELFTDPTYDPNAGKSWWDLHWQKALQWILFAVAVLATVLVSIFNPAAGAMMVYYCLKGALSGFIIGGLIGGVVSASNGNGFWDGLREGAIYGAINGYTVAAVMFGVTQGINAIVNAANRAKVIGLSKHAAIERAKELQLLTGQKPTMTSAAVDAKTGAIYYGDSGAISNNINPILASNMPSISSTKWAVANCAEFNAVNNALNAGSQMQNLVVTTIRVKTLLIEAMCINCQISLQGVLLIVGG